MWTVVQVQLTINSYIKSFIMTCHNNVTKWWIVLFAGKKYFISCFFLMYTVLQDNISIYHSVGALRWGSSGGDVCQEEAHQTYFQWASDICSRENVWADKVLGRAWASKTGLFSGNDGVPGQGKPRDTMATIKTVTILLICMMWYMTNKVTSKCSCVRAFCFVFAVCANCIVE